MRAGWEKRQALDNSGPGKGRSWGGASAAALDSQMRFPVASSGLRGGAQVCRDGSESFARVRARVSCARERAGPPSPEKDVWR